MRGNKLIKNIILSLGVQLVTAICGFIIPKLIIEQYGSAVNGLVSSITQFLEYITFLEAGIGPVIKAALYKPIAKKDKNTIQDILKTSESFFKKIGYIFIVYLIILCIIYPKMINSQFDYWYTVSLIIILSLSIFAQYFLGITYSLYLQAEQKNYITYSIQIVTTVLNAIAVIFLVKFGQNIQTVKLVSSLIFVMRPILQNLYVRKKYKINLTNANNKFELKQKWDGLSQHVAYIIHNNTDIAVLTLMANITEVSVYSVYLLVVNGIRTIIQSFSSGVSALLGDMLAREEKENLEKTFNLYEFIHFSVITIIFYVTFVMIIPFVTVYTKGIKDVNYIRPVFASIMILAELFYACRQPYSSITFAAGHFKQLSKGAWIESISNLTISVVLTFFMGIEGVAIGTFISILIRTIEFISYASKNLLNRKKGIAIKRIFVMIIEIIVLSFISKLLINMTIENYLDWIKYACIVTAFACIIIIGSNMIIFRKDAKQLINLMKEKVFKKKPIE